MFKWKASHYMILSALFFALMDVFLKYVHSLPPFQLVFFRSIGSAIISFPYLLIYRIPVLGNQRKLLVLRSFVGAASMTFFFISVKFLPIGSAVSLRYLAPIFAAGMAVIFLGEKVYGRQWLFFAISFVGVLILKGFDPRINIVGLTFILFSAFFTGWVFMLIRKIGIRDHPMVIVNYFLVITAIIGGIVSIFQWIPPRPEEWPFLVGLGITGFFGQFYMTKAMQVEETNKVAPFKYLEVVFVMIIAYIWFGEGYGWMALLGIAVILLGLILNVLVGRR